MEIESNRKEYESLHPYKWLVLILTSFSTDVKLVLIL